jgi:hypothetical protein
MPSHGIVVCLQIVLEAGVTCPFEQQPGWDGSLSSLLEWMVFPVGWIQVVRVSMRIANPHIKRDNKIS